MSGSGAGAPFLVEWHRPDRRRPLLWVCGTAAVLVSIAAVTAGLALSGAFGVGDTTRQVLGAIAAVCVLGGPLTAVIGIPRALGPEVVLTLRNDAIVWTTPERRIAIEWRSLDSVEEVGGQLVLMSADHPPTALAPRFADIDNPTLRKRIVETQRRALMGLLRRPPRPAITRRGS